MVLRYAQALQDGQVRLNSFTQPELDCVTLDPGALAPDIRGPALRSALYKVLASTPGVQVRTGARDGLGRPAVEISRYESAASVNEETFEDPRTGAVLETAFVYRGDTPEGTDLYLSVTGHRALPPDPYGG